MRECNKDGTQMLGDTQAAEWFVRLKDDDLSEDEQRRYLDWLRQSPNHAAEIGRIYQLHGILKNVLLGSR